MGVGGDLSFSSLPRILEWVAISFSGDHTYVSCLTGGFITTEPSGKPHGLLLGKPKFFSQVLKSLSFAVTLLLHTHPVAYAILWPN